ncbi:MAG: DinB family protein [Methanomassiliicoccales archaeon]
MSELSTVRELFRYNSDVRKKYIECMNEIEWGELIKNREASFPSIRDVFLHVLDAYSWWLDIIEKGDAKDFQDIEPNEIQSVADIKKVEKMVDTRINSFIEKLTEETLSAEVRFRNRRGEHTLKLREILLHLVEEELQHRGEINCMLWQMDVDPPVTGFDDWVERRHKPANKTERK